MWVSVLIAENTETNAHHMPQSISRHRRRLKRIFDRNIKERQLTRGCRVLGGGGFRSGSAGLVQGRVRLHGFWAAFHFAFTQVFGSVSAGLGHLARSKAGKNGKGLSFRKFCVFCDCPFIFSSLPRRAFSRDFAANSSQFVSNNRRKRVVFHGFLEKNIKKMPNSVKKVHFSLTFP